MAQSLSLDNGTKTAQSVTTAPAMSRCECAEISFEKIERLMKERGWSLQEVSMQTRCGRTCSACVPDLEAYLSRE